MRSEPESGRGQDLCSTGGSYLAKRFGFFLAIEKETRRRQTSRAKHNAQEKIFCSPFFSKKMKTLLSQKNQCFFKKTTDAA